MAFLSETFMYTSKKGFLNVNEEESKRVLYLSCLYVMDSVNFSIPKVRKTKAHRKTRFTYEMFDLKYSKNANHLCVKQKRCRYDINININ